MRKIIIVLLLGVASLLHAQNTFIHIYDSARVFYPRDIVFNELGDFFVCSMSWAQNEESYTNYVIKFDPTGNILHSWQEQDTVFDKVEVSRLLLVDDELYLFGFIDRSLPNQIDPAIFLKKYDQSLNLLQSNLYTIDGEFHKGVHHACRVEYSNGIFTFFASAHAVSPEGYAAPFLVEISKEGELIRIAGDRTSDGMLISYDFVTKPNLSGYISFIYEFSQSVYWEGYIYDYDSDMEVLSTKPLPNNFKNFFTSLPLNDSVFYLAGTYKEPGKSLQLGCLQMTTKGDLIDSFLSAPLADSTSYTAYYNSLDFLSCGDIVMCGTYGIVGQFVPQHAPSWISLFRFSPDLELQWHRYIGGDANYEAYSMRISPDDEIVIAGGHSPVPPQSLFKKDLMIMKTDSNGLITGINNEPPAATTTEAILFPNPAGDFVVVDFSLLYKTATLQLTDLAGRAVLERALTANHQQVDITGVPAGAYVYRIFNNKGLEESGKLVVE
jgi:hypothetical protein